MHDKMKILPYLRRKKMSKLISVKTVVAIGIGAALMFVLMRFVSIPSPVPNTTINLGVVVLAFFAAIFGPIAGLLIGFIGHFLTDLTFGWGVWWSWVICSALFGLVVGSFWKLYKIEEDGFGVKECITFNIIQIVANAVVWIGIAPTLDILIYQEPADKVYRQGLTAGGVNAVGILVLASVMLFSYSKTRPKSSSLKAE
jgi:energy-coupling factor transport system substrate-specific component